MDILDDMRVSKLSAKVFFFFFFKVNYSFKKACILTEVWSFQCKHGVAVIIEAVVFI